MAFIHTDEKPLTSHSCGTGRYKKLVWGSKEDCIPCQKEAARKEMPEYQAAVERLKSTLEQAKFADGEPVKVDADGLIELDSDTETIIHTRPDGQVYAVFEVEPGLFQSVFPSDIADNSQLHGSFEYAKSYLDQIWGEQHPDIDPVNILLSKEEKVSIAKHAAQ